MQGVFLFSGKERNRMATKLSPIGEKILVKRLEAEEKTKGGIVLPDTAKEKPKEGKVIAVGEGRLGKDGKRSPFTVKKGDRILFTSYSGTEVTLEGEEYLIMNEEDVLAIVE
jgi:chaperonin GroES